MRHRAPARLLAWYDAVRRDLPWRRTRDPYAIVVSEVMLQQTRVAAVMPRFGAFLELFPGWEALAAADEEAVLAAWNGLGYYRRARFLQQAARAVVALPSGVPRRAEELAKLPGFGAYTAAAVASIAFGEVVPVVDGNVVRLLSRLHAIREPATRSCVRRRLTSAAAALLSSARPGDSNQALMELGATVCTPRAPRCAECPFAGDCKALAEGAPESFPARSRSRERQQLELLSAWVEDAGRVLLFRREADAAWLSGLWELPTARRGDRARDELSARYGCRFELGESLGTYGHEITFRSLTIELVRARLMGTEVVAESREASWVPVTGLSGAATSAMVTKAAGIASGQGKGRRRTSRRSARAKSTPSSSEDQED